MAGSAIAPGAPQEPRAASALPSLRRVLPACPKPASLPTRLEPVVPRPRGSQAGGSHAALAVTFWHARRLSEVVAAAATSARAGAPGEVPHHVPVTPGELWVSLPDEAAASGPAPVDRGAAVGAGPHLLVSVFPAPDSPLTTMDCERRSFFMRW